MNNRYISFGIDLGTSNSCIARAEGDKLTIFANNDNMLVTPSVVRIERNGTVRVGRKAYESILENPENVVSEFKRWMGQKDLKKFKDSGKELSAEELSAEVLKSLLNDARRRSGEAVEAAVVTVPAAFGQLQCAATQRAANLAGLKECPLLQEPIAVAMSYGVSPEMKDQKWIVFDLGGGTFDVAVVSSRDGKLKVLNHQGDNQLGGKDIDKMIVESKFLPVLSSNFDLPNPKKHANAYVSLMQKLRLKAEQAKIDLSLDENVLVELFDLGEDISGNTFDGEIQLSRKELEEWTIPLAMQAIRITREAICEARLTEADIDKVLLAGGPTQMPILRQMLKSELGIAIDLSADPMTAIARGAAVWASSLEQKVERTAISSTSSERLQIDLAYNTVSATVESKVWYSIDEEQNNMPEAIRISAEAGHWDSGWTPYKKGATPITVKLIDGKSCKFEISCRDAQGKVIPSSPSSFTIRHGLVLERPPLPHSVSAEVATGTDSRLDQLFEKGALLPCTAERLYKANRTLKPNMPGEKISINIWEGEVLNAPPANEFVGCLQIASEDIDTVIPEGTEIELSINIDESRLMQVNAYIPLLAREFSDTVYIAERDEQSVFSNLENIDDELDEVEDSIENVSGKENNANFQQEIQQLKAELKELRKQMRGKAGDAAKLDPDQAKRLVKKTKSLKAGVSKLSNKGCSRRDEFEELKKTTNMAAAAIAVALGDEPDKADSEEFANLCILSNRAVERKSFSDLERIHAAMCNLHSRMVNDKLWYWQSRLEYLSQTQLNYSDPRRAANLLSEARKAGVTENLPVLRDCIVKIWQLIIDPETGEESSNANPKILADIR